MHNTKLFRQPQDNIRKSNIRLMADSALDWVNNAERELRETPTGDAAFLYFSALTHYFVFLDRWHLNGRQGSLLKKVKNGVN